MTAAEGASWVAGLNSVTGFTWDHRVDHMARDEFRTIVGNFELHLWGNGRWAIYDMNGIGQLDPKSRPFQEALEQLKRAYGERIRK